MQTKRSGGNLRVLTELSPLCYRDADKQINLQCYADTFVYHKQSGTQRNLVAIRFGGYPEHVRAMADVLCKDARVQAEIEQHAILIQAKHNRYRKILSHDGIYAEGMLVAADDELGGRQEAETEVERSNGKRKLYIFCEEGDTDALFAEVDKKTAIPLLPQFKDYVLEELLRRRILVPLEVLSTCRRFDAYMLELSNDETEVEAVVNTGLKTGRISIPRAVDDTGFAHIDTVSQYLNAYGVTLAQRIRDSFDPLFDPAGGDICSRLKSINAHLQQSAGYCLYPAQLAVAEALKRRLDRAKVGIVVAECGSGKTKIGASALAAHQDGKKCFNVVLCPSHVTKKWVREITETLPDTKAVVVYSIADIDRVYRDFINGDESVYIILSKERARDGYMKKPAVIYSDSRKAYLCPWCYEPIEMDLIKDGCSYRVNADQFFFKKENSQNHKCAHCGNVLWTVLNPYDTRVKRNDWVKIGGYGFVFRRFAKAHYGKTKDLKVWDRLDEIIANPGQPLIARGAYARYSMSCYLARHIRQVDGLIADELHQFKGDSGQGNAMAHLIGCAKSVIGMTATLINGYSSGLFYLLYRICPHLMLVDNKPYERPAAFHDEYGVTERTYQVEMAEGEYNANSRSKKRLVRERQKPGVSPLVYSRFLIDCAVFLSLNNMGKHLPDYEEIPVELHLREDIWEEYEKILESFRHTMRNSKYAQKLMSRYLSLLTTYSDQPYGAEPIFEPGTEEPLIAPPDISSIEELNEKDVAVLDIVKRKTAQGERVLVYTSWVKIDTQEKLKRVLEKEGYRVAVLEQRVSPEKREAWVENQLEKGIDVLITNPSLVETGLDLNAFTTLIFYNVGYNLFTFRQASRRSWRINQTAPRVEVYLLYFEGTMQARAIQLMASKLAAATLVEGNFSDEGLAAMGDCSDMTSQLARELTSGLRNEVEDVGALFQKMAVIKDTESQTAEPPAQTQQISISDKLQKAMELARRAKAEKMQVTAAANRYDDGMEQLSIFDLAS